MQMIFDMLQNFRTNYQIEIFIFKRQIGNIRRCQTPHPAAVIAQATRGLPSSASTRADVAAPIV